MILGFGLALFEFGKAALKMGFAYWGGWVFILAGLFAAILVFRLLRR